MRFAKFNITGKIKTLLVIYLTVIAILICLGILFVSLTTKRVNKYNDIADNSTQKLSLLIGIRKNADYVQVATMRHVIDTTMKGMYEEEKLINKEITLTDSNFSKYKNLINSQEESVLFNKVLLAREANVKARNYLIKLDYENGSNITKPLAYLKNVQKYNYENFQSSITTLSDFLTTEAKLQVEKSNLFAQHIKWLLNICLAVVIIVLLILCYLIFLTINRLRLHNKVLAEKDRNYNKQKQMFRSVLAAAPDGIVGINEEGKIIIFNNQAKRMFGYKRSEILGQNLSILIPSDKHSNHVHHIGQYFKNKVERPMGNATMDLFGIRKNGERFPVDISLSSAETEDGTIAIAGIRDITDRKKTERQLKQLADIIENSNAFVGISNMNRTMEYANDAMRKILDIHTDQDLKELKVLDFYSPESVLKIKDEIVPHVFKMGIWVGQNEWISKTGKIIPVIQVIMLHLNDLGEHEYTSTTAIDISDLKSKEKELIKLAADLRSLTNSLLLIREEERKSIAKDIHDELGQNLTISKLDIAWLIKHLDDDKSLLKEKLEHLQAITQSTIDTSRTLYNSLYPQMLDDVGIVGAIRWHSDNYIKTTNIQVKLRTTLKEEPLMEDHSICLTLFRIYQECFTNILRYAKASRVIINMDIIERQVVMSIEDDGIGFEIDKVDTKVHHGLLGMRERAFALNGSLNIKSEIGKGTTTTISIPLPMDVCSEN